MTFLLYYFDSNMVGIEYILLHVQEPILYVIRKQHRHSPTQVTPIADYYVLAGVVYQAPDLNSLVNSRVHSTLYHLQSAFDETYSYARYHPSKGYWWEFKDTDKDNKEKLDKNKERIKEETPATTFQRQRVDILLNELAKKFPYKTQQQPVQQANDRTQSASNSTAGDSEVKSEIKTEKNDSQNNSFANPNSNRLSGGPPEKKQKLI